MANTRIVVKNLPKQVTEHKIREMFGSNGKLTDVSLTFNKLGKFRQVAFIGYSTEEEAKSAITFFNQTFMGTNKLKIEMCRNLGDVTVRKPHNKHSSNGSVLSESQASASFKYGKFKQERQKDEDARPKTAEPGMKISKNKEVVEMFEKYKSDPQFAEFLEVHRRGENKNLWGNDASLKDIGPADATNISDFEFLKSKVVATAEDSSDDDVDTKDEGKSKKHLGERQKKMLFDFTVKLQGKLWKCKKKDIEQFFLPLKPAQIRFTRSKNKAMVVYVKFSSDGEVKQALHRNDGFLDGHRVKISKVKDTVVNDTQEKNGNKWEKLAEDVAKNGEGIEESGSLFIRNLAYTVTQEQLEQLFGKYGPLADVRIPVDGNTMQIKGFAFIDYVLPEHAVKAFIELDGTIFQGRYLHIIPGMPKPEPESNTEEQSSYKKEKASQQKATSSSSHNWNTLFLGANAVADVMTEKYNTSKHDLLNPESDNLAVRMALGETQLVIETRNFLISHGIQLDAFSQPATERSKTVFLVKNLPAKTSEGELWRLFSPYGQVSRIVLPPMGITAIVEFLHPTEAKRAFRNLAYSKFSNVPLYLEWAPIKIFSSTKTDADIKKEEEVKEGDKISPESNENQDKEDKVEDDDDDEEEDEEDEEAEDGANVFVKNLNLETTKEKLAEHFEKCGRVISATISQKKDLKNPGNLLSLGYGFVQFQTRANAEKAIKEYQHSVIDGHVVELKISDRAVNPKVTTRKKKKSKSTKQRSSKILVRNIAFEATTKEVDKLFRTFGELKSVRLPKKMLGPEKHRGFGFVEFVSRADAKRAFEALCHSTHFYGRHLVLEWANTDSLDVDTLRRKTASDFYEGVPAPKKMRKAVLMEQLVGL